MRVKNTVQCPRSGIEPRLLDAVANVLHEATVGIPRRMNNKNIAWFTIEFS